MLISPTEDVSRRPASASPNSYGVSDLFTVSAFHLRFQRPFIRPLLQFLGCCVPLISPQALSSPRFPPRPPWYRDLYLPSNVGLSRPSRSIVHSFFLFFSHCDTPITIFPLVHPAIHVTPFYAPSKLSVEFHLRYGLDMCFPTFWSYAPKKALPASYETHFTQTADCGLVPVSPSVFHGAAPMSTEVSISHQVVPATFPLISVFPYIFRVRVPPAGSVGRLLFSA